MDTPQRRRQRQIRAPSAALQTRPLRAARSLRARPVLCCLLLVAAQANAQPVVPPSAAANPSSLADNDVQERRRAQDRERLLREQQERTPDVRLAPAPVADERRLPADETPCRRVDALRLEIMDGERSSTADTPFAGLLDQAAAGPDSNDPPTGRCLGPQGIAMVIRRVQDALIAQGYITTRVLAAPQDLASGTLTLTLVPGRIHAIRFTADSDARGNARTALPARPGDLLNLRDIEQALENFKRVPTAEADIQIEAAATADGLPGQSDLVIRYRQPQAFRASVSLDDSGAKATGRYQAGLTLSYDNAFTLNDLLYLSLNHGVVGPDHGTQGNTAHYSVPLGYWLLGLTASNSRYHQTAVGPSQTYVYSGKSSNTDVKLSRLVYRDAFRKTTVALRAFQRTSSNQIDDTEIVPQHRVVGGFEASVNHRAFMGEATLDLNLAYKRGTGAFGALPAAEEAFGEGTSRMRITSFDATLTTPLKALGAGVRYTGVLRGQYNQSSLTPQDRFAIGGRYTVRGFDGEGSLSAERGWLLRNELAMALGASGQEIFAGLDHGRIGGASTQWMPGKSLTGAVVGLRGTVNKLQYELFVGAPVKKPEFFTTAKVTAGFSLNYGF